MALLEACFCRYVYIRCRIDVDGGIVYWKTDEVGSISRRLDLIRAANARPIPSSGGVTYLLGTRTRPHPINPKHQP